MTTSAAAPTPTPPTAGRRVHGVAVGAETYLFDRAYDAERFIMRIRAQHPRRLGVLPVFDPPAAAALIAKT